MPNVITDISPSPSTIASGSTTTLTISYIADQGGTCELRTSAAFSLSATRIMLPPTSNGSVNLDVTIQRVDPHGPKRCDILATFAGSAIHTIIQVN
jgi:hypothetical protein